MEEERRLETLASDAERQAAGDALQQACVEGRLTLEEFSQRVGLAHAARTRGRLDEITRDLPEVSQTIVNRPSVSSVAVVLSGDERSGPWRIGED